MIPPLSPITTRSSVRAPGSNLNNSATPLSAEVVSEGSDSLLVQSVVSQEIKSLEARFDARFSRMEDNMRSALCNREQAVVPLVAAAPIVPPVMVLRFQFQCQFRVSGSAQK